MVQTANPDRYDRKTGLPSFPGLSEPPHNPVDLSLGQPPAFPDDPDSDVPEQRRHYPYPSVPGFSGNVPAPSMDAPDFEAAYRILW